MITVSTTYDNIIANGGHYEWQVLNGANTWTTENLISGSLEYSVFRTLSIGGTNAAQLDLTLWNVTVDTSSPLVLQFRAISENEQSEWVTKGTYYIDKLESSPYSEQTKITAFDSMLKTEVIFMTEGQWTTKTAAAVVGLIATEIGVTVEASTWTYISTNAKTLVNSPEIGENGTTDREMLSYIGALYGGNWVINSNNELQLILLYQTPTDIAPVGDAVRDFDASKTETIAKVRVWVSNNGYYLSPPIPLQTHLLEDITTHGLDPIEVYATLYEAEWNAIEGAYIEANIPIYGSQAVAEDLYSLFNGKSFIPYESDRVFIDPKYEVGDGITIKDITTLIATQIISIDALAVSSLVFEAQGELQSMYPYLDKKIRSIQFQLSQNTALVDALGQTVSGASYRQQTIYMSVASVTDAPTANTTWVTDNSGQQNVWTTKRPVYSSEYPVLFIATQRQTVGQESGTECYCSTPEVDQTTTVIDGGHITTGTIDAGQVNVINIDASNIDTGTLNADIVDVINLNADNITSGTISADRIKAGTIADDLETPNNYWNLTTGEFVTERGELGGWTINQNGLLAEDGLSKATIYPGNIREESKGYTNNRAAGFEIGSIYEAVNIGDTWYKGLTIIATSNSSEDTVYGTISGYYGVGMIEFATNKANPTTNNRINIDATTISITATTFTVNNHSILEVH